VNGTFKKLAVRTHALPDVDGAVTIIKEENKPKKQQVKTQVVPLASME